MTRLSRKKSTTGIYHVMLRGANKQDLFLDDQDRLRFLFILKMVKEEAGANVFSWCLMNNHVHLIIKEIDEDISSIMKRINVRFVWYFNKKYGATGHLFQDRFKSEAIETNGYLLTAVRYIHRNPVNARLVLSIDEWKWSSYRSYLGHKGPLNNLLDKEFVLSLFSQNNSEALEQFETHTQHEDESVLEQEPFYNLKRLNDDEARLEIEKIIDGITIPQVKGLPKKDRDLIVRDVKRIEGITQRQAARILGLTYNMVFKVKI